MHDSRQCFHDAGALKRRLPRQELVQDGAQAVDVDRGGDVLVGRGLLRRHVAGRADDGAGLGGANLAAGPLGQPKVGDMRLPLGVQQDVGGFDIAVHATVFVSVIQCRGDLFEVVLRFA
jgi:hypothetical protein